MCSEGDLNNRGLAAIQLDGQSRELEPCHNIQRRSELRRRKSSSSPSSYRPSRRRAGLDTTQHGLSLGLQAVQEEMEALHIQPDSLTQVPALVDVPYVSDWNGPPPPTPEVGREETGQRGSWRDHNAWRGLRRACSRTRGPARSIDRLLEHARAELCRVMEEEKN